MNIIYFGVTIFALLISREAYAMEELENIFSSQRSVSRTPSPEQPMANENNEHSSASLIEHNLKIVMNNKIYIQSTLTLPSPEIILGLCETAKSKSDLSAVQKINIDHNYAGAYMHLGDYGKAAHAFRRVLEEKTLEGNFVIEGRERFLTIAHLSGLLKAQSQMNEAIQAGKEALEVKDKEGRIVVRGLARVGAFCELADELAKVGRHEEASIYYYKALKAKNERTCFLLRDAKRKTTLMGLSGVLTKLDREQEANEFIQKDADFFHSRSFQILIHAIKEEGIFVDLNCLNNQQINIDEQQYRGEDINEL
ncbi:MAG TPA: tetratricopeptide repeat protein, partial [Alphaproteobacteria bacterium]|nr:tetratricopeptide repeat protein [Alphaproteobacteria bacterium]